MKIGLIGMSGVGKTLWAERLHTAGFACYHCDDLIAARLQARSDLPVKNFHQMGKWMGFPYEAGFAQREQQYLTLENAVLDDILDELNSLPPEKNAVIDTTGSVIYLATPTLQRLKNTVRLVYLAITPEVQHQMLADYLRQPRPIVWHGLFNKAAHETNQEALAREYLKLVAYRQNLYEQLCAVKIEYAVHRQPGLDVNGLLEKIRRTLQNKPPC